MKKYILLLLSAPHCRRLQPTEKGMDKIKKALAKIIINFWLKPFFVYFLFDPSVKTDGNELKLTAMS